MSEQTVDMKPETEQLLVDSLCKFLYKNKTSSIIQIMAEFEFNLNKKNSIGIYPIEYIVKTDGSYCKTSLNCLIDAGLDLNLQIDHGQTLIHRCIESNFTSTVIELLSYRNYVEIDIEKKDQYGHSLLHEAVFNRNTDIIKALCKEKCDCNVQDHDGCTPLMYIALGHMSQIAYANKNRIATDLEIVNLLLKYGADKCIKNKKNQTAYDCLYFSSIHLEKNSSCIEQYNKKRLRTVNEYFRYLSCKLIPSLLLPVHSNINTDDSKDDSKDDDQEGNRDDKTDEYKEECPTSKRPNIVSSESSVSSKSSKSSRPSSVSSSCKISFGSEFDQFENFDLGQSPFSPIRSSNANSLDTCPSSIIYSSRSIFQSNSINGLTGDIESNLII